MQKIISIVGFLIVTTVIQAHAGVLAELPLNDFISNLDPEPQSVMKKDLDRVGIDPAKASQVQIQIANGSIVVQDPSHAVTPDQLFFLGFRIGAVFMAGLEAQEMFLDSDSRPHYDISAEAATTFFWSTINAGFAVHPNRGAFYMGGRIHYITTDPLDGEPHKYFGVGPEIGATFLFGHSDRFMGNLGLGVPVVFNVGDDPDRGVIAAVVPDFRAGISVRIGH
jgi:hypothetical protein